MACGRLARGLLEGSTKPYAAKSDLVPELVRVNLRAYTPTILFDLVSPFAWACPPGQEGEWRDPSIDGGFWCVLLPEVVC